MKKRFLKFIKEKNIVKSGDKILVGLSGGPDSVCMLNLLCSIRDEEKIEVAAAHINHMLRGEEADKDEEYSKRLCESLGVRFFSKRIDINKYALETGKSSELAGREARYDFFNEIINKINFNKIATAHNANDQAETILMRIMRGTGLEGLGGIPVAREGKYIRPILFMKREEVEQYCKENNLNPHIDATNLERIYSRNKVRLDILPYMKNNFNPNIVETINRMALLLQDDNEFIEEEVNKAYKDNCFERENSIVISKNLFNIHSAIVTRVIRKALFKINKSNYDMEMKNIEDIIELSNLGTNKRVDLPKDIYAENVYGDIIIRKKEYIKNKLSNELILNKKDILHNEVIFDEYIINFDVVNNKDIKQENDELIKKFDYDKINIVTIRYRKDGDRITPLGMKGSKKLKDIFIDMKIPKEKRDEIPLIQFNDDISWIVGIKMSDKFKITKETKHILKVSVKRKEL
ncbi:MAG: tRNA lysidine(34) synthetase TilS [Clostridium sp.]|nr:tRNA lysidine(34) synthetase TilS [Clostridium sp.]